MTQVWESIDEIGLKPENMVPLGDRLLIKRAKRATKSGGIIIPDDAQQPQYLCKVCAVGEDAVKMFEVGDLIVIGRWQSSSFKLIDNPDAELESDRMSEYNVISMEDVWFKVEGVSTDI